jgi:hypothetical protein
MFPRSGYPLVTSVTVVTVVTITNPADTGSQHKI